jgi:predicted DNA-binding protein (MmcQ/YjbR family)
MSAVAGCEGDADPKYAFKASDLAFEMLVEQGLARPAPYMARAKWVQLLAPDSLPDDELRAYLAQAHGLVAAKLTRKARAELGLG